MNKIYFSNQVPSNLNNLRVSRFSGLFSATNKDQENVYIPPLTDLSYEIFPEIEGNEVRVTKKDAGIMITSSENYALVRIELFEDDKKDLEILGYEAYKEVFNFLKGEFKYFVRAWNYIPNILDVHNDLERYRKFNIGRWNAWQEHGPKFDDGTPIRPAATGIGSFGGPLIIETLFSKYPVTYIENPRQKQFVHYSEKWGPKPPVSARGTLLHTPTGNTVFIAGTASLVGEEIAHENDIEKQTRETLENIRVLISKENMQNYDLKIEYTLEDVDSIRVYVKHPKDLEKIKEILGEVWQKKKILYIHDDICRPGFLIEIEGVIYPSIV